MAYNGSSIGGVVFSPLWVAAIAVLGFPIAAAVIGLAAIITIWVLAAVFFAKSPELLGLMPDGGPAQLLPPPLATAAPRGAALWRNVKFITLAAGMAASLFAQIGLLAHLFSLLVPPLGVGLAGLAMSGATVAAIAGRTLAGWLMPASADRRLIACASYGVQIAGSVALLAAAGTNIPLLLIGVLLFGLGIGNATSLPPLIAQAEFAKDDVARVVPLIIAIAQACYAFAPAAFGLVRQLTVATRATSPRRPRPICARRALATPPISAPSSSTSCSTRCTTIRAPTTAITKSTQWRRTGRRAAELAWATSCGRRKATFRCRPPTPCRMRARRW
jgi:hypothetical protein